MICWDSGSGFMGGAFVLDAELPIPVFTIAESRLPKPAQLQAVETACTINQQYGITDKAD